MSKAGLDHLLGTWAVELEGSGVAFLSVDPGEMDTDMHAQAVPGADRATLADPASVAKAIADVVEGGRFRSGERLELSALAPPAGRGPLALETVT